MKIETLKNAAVTYQLQKTAYCIQKEDLKTAAQAMAAAFGGDPSIRYLLGGESVGKNDWRYFLTFLKALQGKCVMLSSDRTVQNLLILLPPDLKTVPTMRFFFRGGVRLWRFLDMGLYRRSIRYENNCQAIKKRFLTSDTWYCMCFVVSPEKQGRGVGAALLRPALRVLEEYGQTLYLETHKKTNVSIYEHFGFALADVSTIPGTNIEQYAMFKSGEAKEKRM